MRFQSYLSPKYKTSCKISMLIETAAIVEDISSLISIVIYISTTLHYRKIVENMVRLSSSYVKSSLSIKTRDYLN